MAGRASLTFLGQEDIFLSGNPQVTYFNERYTGKIPFASRLDRALFDTQVRFGQESKVQLQNRGDLISQIYLKVNFPQISTGVCDSVAAYMIKYVDLTIDGVLLERLYGEYIEMRNDLTISQSKQASLTGLEGKIYPQLVGAAAPTYTLPLPFSCMDKGLDIRNSKAAIKLILRPSTDFTYPQVNWTLPIDLYLLVEYVYFTEPINRGLQFFEQVQKVEFFAPAGANSLRCTLGFMNPVKELFVVVQNTNAFGFDYTTDGTQTAYGKTEQLNYLVLKFNGVERIPKEIGTALYLRVIQAFENHTRVPDRKFYMYSFSLDPQGSVPAGQVNMSRILNQILELSLNPSSSARNIRVYAVSYNFIDNNKILFTNIEESGELKQGIIQ